MKLLEDLDDYGRKILADALVPCQFIEGEAIFRQGCRDVCVSQSHRRAAHDVVLLASPEVRR